MRYPSDNGGGEATAQAAAARIEAARLEAAARQVAAQQAVQVARQNSLINAALSGAGAVIAGIGCAGSGITCGMAVILGVDAYRQLSKAITGNDPLAALSTNLGANELQAENIALGADFLTATMSINSAFKGLFMNSYRPLTTGVFGVVSLDIFSTVNTVQQLNVSVKSQ